MQPQTKPIAAVFAAETQLDVLVKTDQGQPFPEIDEPPPTMAVNPLVSSANRYSLIRGVPHSALHD